MQITRQRVRPALEIQTDEVCPTCGGTGHSRASILLVDELEEKVELARQMLHYRKVRLEVHPYIAAYIRRGLINTRLRWLLQYGVNVRICERQNFGLLEYRFYDKSNEEINFRAIAHIVNDR